MGAYLFIIFTFTCQYDQLVGVCSGRLKKGVLALGAGTARKRGDLGAGGGGGAALCCGPQCGGGSTTSCGPGSSTLF